MPLSWAFCGKRAKGGRPAVNEDCLASMVLPLNWQRSAAAQGGLLCSWLNR